LVIEMGLYPDSVDAVNQANEDDERRAAAPTSALLTRAQLAVRFGISPYEVKLLLRREDFVRLCSLRSEEGTEPVRFIPGQVERWLREGDWVSGSDAARAPNTWAILAIVAQAFLRAVGRPGGLEKVA
jgi:hypothetical protein